jgi:peroxiredoxin
MKISGVLMLGVVGAVNASSAVQPGAPAPDFSFSLPGGTTGRLSSLKGHVVVLDFWASWCGWCQKEAPEVNALNSNYADVAVLGVDDESTDVIASASSKLGMNFPTTADPGTAIGNAYGAKSIPRVVVIDAEGIVRAVIDGYPADDTLDKAVRGAEANIVK